MAPGPAKTKKRQISSGFMPKRNSVLDAPIAPPKSTTSSSSIKGYKGIGGTFQTNEKPTHRLQALMQARTDIKKELLAAGKEPPSKTPGPSTQAPDSGVSSRTLEPPLSSAPVGDQPKNENTSDPCETAFEENILQQTDASGETTQNKKPVRGHSRGVELNKEIERTGKKREVAIHPVFGRPVTRLESSALGSSLGNIAHLFFWPINKNRDKDRILDEGILMLEVKLNLGDIRENGVEMEKLWGLFQNAVRRRRANTKRDFYTNKAHPRQNKPPYLSQEKWDDLCDHWGTEKVQGIAEENTSNRGQVVNLNTQGSVAYVCLYEEQKSKAENGAMSKMEFYKWQDTKDTREWRTPSKNENYEKMQFLVESTRDTKDPISEDEAFHMILGYKSGYCHGLGIGQSPPKKRSRAALDYAQFTQVLKENEQLLADKELLQERCTNLEGKVIELDEKQTVADLQISRFEKIANYIKDKNIFGDLDLW
ncbi:unnamed protein product [Linum trigynum]|uniref:Uncharacterized protein n=1 Tax=Linum trigynum TaxID=586398 RepID=A0AAV2ESQ9_9ROSI